MEEKNFFNPDITGRKAIARLNLKPGDIVVFAQEQDGKIGTGFMVLDEKDPDWYKWAFGLCSATDIKSDEVPFDDTIYFEATKEEKLNVFKIYIFEFVTSMIKAYGFDVSEEGKKNIFNVVFDNCMDKKQ